MANPSRLTPPTDVVEGAQFGSFVVVGECFRTRREWRVPVRCVHLGECNTITTATVRRLRDETKVRACKNCFNRVMPRWAHPLYRRVVAAQQRCTKSSDPNFHRYGGRGIEFRFDKPSDAVVYMINELGVTADDLVGKQLDRKDNDGHYERGNLRMSTPLANTLNRNNTRYWQHGAQQIPMSHAAQALRTEWPDMVYTKKQLGRYWDRYGMRTFLEVRAHFERHKHRESAK